VPVRSLAGRDGRLSSRALSAKLDWAATQVLSDEALEERLYGRTPEPGASRAMPDCAYLHAERRRPGVTLELLHLEYLEKHPDGYRYTQFCDIYRRWLSRRGLVMRHVHHGGDKLFVDYAGKKPHIVDGSTGELVEVELFVAVLGASNFTYAEAMVRWAAKVGPSTAMLVDAILRERRHPEQGYRSCLGILRLSKVYGEARLEAACARAVAVRASSYKHVASILKHGLDRLPPLEPTPAAQVTLEEHENVRGEKYVH